MTNGNMTAGAGKSFTWTSYNMPLTVTQGSTVLGFTYKPDHQRLKVRERTARADMSALILYLIDRDNMV